MHDYQPLVSRALSLLFRHFNQRKETLQHLNQVQLLVSETDIQNYKQIKRDLDQLRLFVEKSELWVYKKGKDGMPGEGNDDRKEDEFDMKVGEFKRGGTDGFLLCCLKKLASSSGLTESDLDSGGPMINEESAYRYTSIFQVREELSLRGLVKNKQLGFMSLRVEHGRKETSILSVLLGYP